MNVVAENWKTLLAEIGQECARNGRDAKEAREAKEVRVVAVSKRQDFSRVKDLLLEDSFSGDLGENYLDGLISRRREVKLFLEELETTGQESLASSIREKLRWHFIGSIQSRKLKEICEVAHVLHGVSREKELNILSSLASDNGTCPQFFVQVNISGETSKSGLSVSEVAAFMKEITELNLSKLCCGFMGMAAPVEVVGKEQVRKQFESLRLHRDQHLLGKSLSMGMSGDYQLAIAEGATHIRVGTSVFGAR